MRCGYEAGESKKMPEMKGTCGKIMGERDVGVTYTDLEVSVCKSCMEK